MALFKRPLCSDRATKGGFILAQFKGTVVTAGKAWWLEEAGGSWSLGIHSEEQTIVDAEAQLTLLFVQTGLQPLGSHCLCSA